MDLSGKPIQSFTDEVGEFFYSFCRRHTMPNALRLFKYESFTASCLSFAFMICKSNDVKAKQMRVDQPVSCSSQKVGSSGC